MVEGEQKEIGWKAGEEHVQEGGERGQKLGHRLTPLTRAGPPLVVPGQGHICPTEDPGFLTTLKLDDYTGSGGRESCERQPSEGPATAQNNQLPNRWSESGLHGTQCHLCNQENPQVAP